MSNVFLLVLILYGGREQSIAVAPRAYVTQSDCDKAGVAWVLAGNGHDRNYNCIASPDKGERL